jgi:serine/threonine protein kinase
MGTGKKWEEIRRIGGGGQSTVFLVRTTERMVERYVHLQKLMELSAQSFNEVRAQEFAHAAFEYSRDEHPSELGAMKKFDARAAGAEGEQHALDRLKSEIAVLEEKKPGLLKLLDSDESERWIVTEYCPGGTLEEHPFTCTGNAGLALTLFRSLVETVAELHKENIVHRDIKPANVFIGSGGRLILGDFGIVFLPNQPQRMTFTHESVGPRDYMPPWAGLGQRTEEIKPNFDVYMLGKLLWCMVAGRSKLPREWHRRPDYDLTRQFADNPDMHLINAILDKCLVENPDGCLKGAQDLLKEVDRALGIVGRRGQALAPGVPRPCHVCGVGFYEAEELVKTKLGTSVGSLRVWNKGGNDPVNLEVETFVCDHCDHVEFFTTRHVRR